MTTEPRPARTSPPRLTRVIHRPRLFRSLDQLRASPLVWIQAPAGAGKTSLVASWVAARGLASAWLTLQAGDDPAALFADLHLAARGRRGALPDFRPEHLSDPGGFARSFFRGLATERRRPEVLVLDDYHVLDPVSLLHGMLRDGITELAGRTTVVVASREPPPASWARFRADGRMSLLDPQTLALTSAETRAVARARARKRPPPDEALAVANGWAAGVVLLAVAADGRGDAWRADPRHAFEYLAVEVFDGLDRRTRDVLLRTSVLPIVGADAAIHLSGDAEAGERLARLARLGAFTDRLAGATPAFRYHDLFRAFLLARLEATAGRDGVADLARAAASWLLHRGEVDAALETLATHEVWDGLAAALEETAPRLVRAGRLEAIRRWIDLLPPQAAHGRPWLRYWRAVSRFPREPLAAAEDVAEAHASFAAVGDAAGTYLSWAAAVDMTLFSFHDLARVDAWLDGLESLRRQFRAFPSPEVEAAVVASAVGGFTNRRPTDPRADEWEERAIGIALAPGDAVARLNTARHLLMRRAYWGGDVVATRPVVETLRPIAADPQAPLTDALLWHAMDSAFLDHAGRARDAAEVARKGLALAARTGVHAFDALLHVGEVFAALSDEDFAAADRALEALARCARDAPRLVVFGWHHLASTVAVRRGDARDALQRARLAAAIAVEAGNPVTVAAAHLSWAVAAARGGGAGPTLEEAEARARRDGFGYGAMVAPLVRASLRVEAGDDAAAAAVLRDVFPAMRRTGCMNASWLGRAQLAELCALALEREIESGFVMELVRTRALRPGPRARWFERWPRPVRVDALGGFHVAPATPPRRTGRRPPRKLLELLRVLVAHGPRGARAEAVADALWPDADGDAARHALDTAVYRVRQLLGDVDAVATRGGRLALDPDRVFVDAWALEALLAQAQALQARGEVDAAQRVAARAADLDAGEPFGDDGGGLVAFARERFRRALESIRAIDVNGR